MVRNRSLLLVLACFATFRATLADTPVDRELDADAHGNLEVRNVAGSIDIVGWDRAAVHVTGTLADSVERLDFTRNGDRVVVEVVLRKDSRSSHGTDLKVSAPRASVTDVSTVSAAITVTGIEGEQRLNTVSGTIKTEAFAGDLTVGSVSGEVTVQGHGRGAVTRAHSVSGAVRLAGLAGEVEAQAVSGAVEVTADKVARATLNSVSGHVSLRGTLDEHARVELTTTSGDIVLLFASPAAADYDLATFSGSIKNCFGPPAPEPRNGPQRQNQFREGDSDARVHANTMSGSVSLCRQ